MLKRGTATVGMSHRGEQVLFFLFKCVRVSVHALHSPLRIRRMTVNHFLGQRRCHDTFFYTPFLFASPLLNLHGPHIHRPYAQPLSQARCQTGECVVIVKAKGKKRERKESVRNFKKKKLLKCFYFLPSSLSSMLAPVQKCVIHHVCLSLSLRIFLFLVEMTLFATSLRMFAATIKPVSKNYARDNEATQLFKQLPLPRAT